MATRGLKKVYRTNSAGCLDVCEHGASMVIYPQNTWYGQLQLSDIPEIIEESILKNNVIDRLLIPSKKQETGNID